MLNYHHLIMQNYSFYRYSIVNYLGIPLVYNNNNEYPYSVYFLRMSFFIMSFLRVLLIRMSFLIMSFFKILLKYFLLLGALDTLGKKQTSLYLPHSRIGSKKVFTTVTPSDTISKSPHSSPPPNGSSNGKQIIGLDKIVPFVKH
jgi:hypothetical protein